MGQTGASGQTPMCPMCMNMMAVSDMPDAMRMRMDVMMRTPIYADSPCAIYGRADRLGLTDEQQAQLAEIENEVRQKALDVLTPEQREALGELPDSPMTMMQMCKRMSARMMPKMPGASGSNQMGGAMMGCCPMMGGDASEGSGTKPEGLATK